MEIREITVEPGDTLWSLCEKHLGNPYRWAYVAMINGLYDPDLIRPGQVLRFPERTS